MSRFIKIVVFFFSTFIVCGVFGFSEIAKAAATVPFSSTFDCPESYQTSWSTTITDCPGWQGNGGWTTVNGSRARISSLDNNPSGGGGRGFGQAVGDGSNNNGGGTLLTFPAQSELWIRWYMRFPFGFSWNNGQPYYLKIIRLRGPSGADTDHIVQFRDWDNAYFGFVDQLSRYPNLGGSCGWTCIMGGSRGDGQWHSYEVHLKVGNPGILEGWIDGNQVFRHADILVYGPQGITSMSVYDNSTNPNNGTDQYVSYDDFAISNTGYIGPIGPTPDTTPPSSPTNLSATAPSASSITISWDPATDNIGVTNYQVERCTGLSCSNFTQVGTPTSSPFTDSNLTASTGYSYHVRAVDAAGNTSDWSNVVGTTTQGTPTPQPCSTVTPTNFTTSTYTGYGAPYDVFSNNTPLISTTCTSSDTHTINATLGITGDTTRIVYTKGYYYDPGISDWTSFTGTCTGALNGDWCQGSVSTTLTDTDISTTSASNPAYLVGMTCSIQGGRWKCGCRDTTCSTFYWQVQGAGM